MRGMLAGLALVVALGAPATSASAVCIYGGELDARTTLDQEFRDAPVVVRGTVLSARDLRPWGEDGEWGTAYQVRVDRAFKGAPPAILTYFTERNSGGFYLDAGQTYLLFLVPRTDGSWAREIPDAYRVNYSCGQSRRWSELTTSARSEMARHSN